MSLFKTISPRISKAPASSRQPLAYSPSHPIELPATTLKFEQEKRSSASGELETL